MSGTSPGSAKILQHGASPRGWHRLQIAAECLQKYAWHYQSPEGSPTGLKGRPALAKGSLIHLALAQHYARMKARQQGTREDEWCEPEEAVQLIAKVEGVEEFVSVVLRTFRAYVQHYAYDESDWKIVDIENLVSVTIGGKYLITGRLDLVVEDLTGRIFVWDHKSSSRLTARHKQFYAVSGQLIGYSHMARQTYGERFAGFIVNLIQLSAGPNDPFKADRVPLPRSPNMESRYEQTIVDLEESIERMKASGRSFDNWPKAMNELTCFSRYGACDHINQCRHGYGASAAGNWTWIDDSKR